MSAKKSKKRKRSSLDWYTIASRSVVEIKDIAHDGTVSYRTEPYDKKAVNDWISKDLPCPMKIASEREKKRVENLNTQINKIYNDLITGNRFRMYGTERTPVVCKCNKVCRCEQAYVYNK